MKILITGSDGFVGQNLLWNLREIRDGKNHTRPNLIITDLYEYDVCTDELVLEEACRECGFVFNLVGVNRPENEDEFMKGNFGFVSFLLEKLKKYENTCPVMMASSSQASLSGRFENSEYGKSKLAGEELLFRYAKETGAKVLVYRFPNLFGKWCKPNYNSAVATFCNAVAKGESYTVNNPDMELELLYIDDLISEMLDALEGKEHRCDYPVDNAHDGMLPVWNNNGRFCSVPVVHHATLGEIVELLNSYREIPNTHILPLIPKGSFEKKLYSTYLSYLPQKAISYNLAMNVDNRGIFTELLKTDSHGQVSINIVRPGVTRGQHWHNSKGEIFIVVSGHGLIEERKIGIDPETGKEYPVVSFEVTGEQMKAVQMLPGYAHSITNLSAADNLVTVMWANEIFDENNPDTFYECVNLNRLSSIVIEDERVDGI